MFPLWAELRHVIRFSAVENIECYVPVPDSLKRGRELFVLRVQGESIINAGIFPNDILIVHRTPVAENRQIVVALVGDEATVKRFYKENGHFRTSGLKTIILNRL